MTPIRRLPASALPAYRPGPGATARGALGAAALAVAVSQSVVAQPAPVPGSRPGWLPAEHQWSAGVTPAQRATAMGVLRRIERILLAIPDLAVPNGFEIRPAFAGGTRPAGPDGTVLPNGVVRYNLGLMFFAPTRAIAGEGRVCISVVVNDGPPSPKHRGERGLPIYVEGDRGKPVPHATQVYGELWNVPGERSFADVLFTTAGQLPWRPVTREDFIQALIFDVEGADGAKKSELEASFAKTPYQEWIEGAAERKRTRDQTLREFASIQGAAEAEKMRQTLESTEREVTERLRQSEAADRERLAEARAGVSEYGGTLRATLAQMSPAERAMPALVDNALTEGPLVAGYRLTSDDAPPAWRVLTPEYGFWRARRSPVEVRSIRVSIGISGTCLRETIHRALWRAFHELDWAAINGLLEQPR